MGNANAHTNNNLPVLIAGGGFRHGQHLVFDRQRNYFRRCFLILRLSDRRRHDWKAPPLSTMISVAPATT